MTIAGPTNDRLIQTIVYWPVAAFQQVRADTERSVIEALDLMPELAERIRGGRRVERYRGTADNRGVFRRSHGPGWALVGDARYHKDPITAQGITDAFHGAELWADAVDARFSERQPLDEALAGYERARNEAVMPMVDFTAQLAALAEPEAQTRQLFGA